MGLSIDTRPEENEAIPGEGPSKARVAFIGSAPSIARNGKNPFGASSLGLIRSMEKVAGESVYLTNLVKVPHSTKNKVPKTLVRKHYASTLEELQAVKPERILALGVEAAESFCPGFKNLREDHGTMFYNPELEAYVIPTLHFSAISRNDEALQQILEDAKRLFNLPEPEKPEMVSIIGKADLGRVFDALDDSGLLFTDIETTGLSFRDDSLIAIGFTDSTTRNKAWRITEPDLQLEFIRLVKHHDKTIVGQNLQFDLSRLTYWAGLDEWYPTIIDTMVTAHVLGERVLSLKHLTSKYTNRPGSRAYGGPQDPLYLAEDVLSTREVYQYFQAKMEREPWILPILFERVPALANMQRRGVFVDRPFLLKLLTRLHRKTKRALDQLNDEFGEGINWNASAQVVKKFQEAGIRLRDRTPGGDYSVAEATLLKLGERYPAVQNLLGYREAVKEEQFVVSYLSLTTDLDPFLRPRLKMTGTETGRLSCVDPNLQQVPREGPIKLCFRSRWKDGKIALVDLSQAELRVVALLSDDEVLTEALLSGDVHLYIASRVFRKAPEDVTAAERKKSKGITFGLLYGGSPEGLAARLGIPVKEVEAILAEFFGVFKKLAAWIKREIRAAAKSGQSVTIFDRVRDLRLLMIREGKKGAARKATNTPVQSIASDCDLIILGEADRLLRKRKLKTRPVLGVHDSIIFDVYPGEDDAVIQAVGEAFQSLNSTPLASLGLWGKLPLVGELVFGDSWAAVESTNINYMPESSTPLSSFKEAA